MKKILVVLMALVVFTSGAFAAGIFPGDLNVRAGLDTGWFKFTDKSMLHEREQQLKSSDAGFSVGAEYLIGVPVAALSKAKVGLGLQYLFPRSVDNIAGAPEFSWTVIYISAKYSPFVQRYVAPVAPAPVVKGRQPAPVVKPVVVENPLAGLFFKLNLGYAAAYISDIALGSKLSDKEDKTGYYYGIAAGYDFDNGLFVEAVYDFYDTKTNITKKDTRLETEVGSFSKVGLNVGYKFKIKETK
jgi:opacity protein-like surface antigen